MYTRGRLHLHRVRADRGSSRSHLSCRPKHRRPPSPPGGSVLGTHQQNQPPETGKHIQTYSDWVLYGSMEHSFTCAPLLRPIEGTCRPLRSNYYGAWGASKAPSQHAKIPIVVNFRKPNKRSGGGRRRQLLEIPAVDTCIHVLAVRSLCEGPCIAMCMLSELTRTG